MSNNTIKTNNVLEIINQKGKRERIRKAKSKANFTLINTACLQDQKISMSALGMLAYLMSLPSDWEISVSHLSRRFDCSKDKVYSTINALIKLGYMVRYQERNESGIFGEWITEATDDPSLLKDNQTLANTELSPHTEKPEAVKTGSGKTYTTKNTKNKSLKNNKQIPTPIQSKPELQRPFHETDPTVVVSLMEKIQKWAIAKTLLKTWLKKYSAEYILEKIEYTKVHAKTNPAGFLRKAVENNYRKYLANEPKAEQKPPVELMWPSHEENLTWYTGLSDENKQKCFNEAIRKHAHFEEMLKIEKVNFKSAAFLKTTWFKMMMQLVGRAK